MVVSVWLRDLSELKRGKKAKNSEKIINEISHKWEIIKMYLSRKGMGERKIIKNIYFGWYELK